VACNNDTLILSRKQSEDGFLDTLFITLDGKNVIQSIRSHAKKRTFFYITLKSK
jgi:hypothetical protein